MQELYFIVNPLSGSGKAKRLFEELRALLDENGVVYSYAYTQYHAHAVTLAQEALHKGARRIIAVGGDGTAQQVASVVAGTDALMGLCPFGTGNDFARPLGLPSLPAALLPILTSNHTRRVDLGVINGHARFINIAGFGFDVDVVHYTEKYKRHFNGMLPYLMGIFQSLLHLRPLDVELVVDGGDFAQKTRISERLLLLSACNGTHFAGGIHIAPLARNCDGLLDVCLVRAMSVPVFLRLLAKCIKGKHLSDPHIRYFKAREIQIRVQGVDSMQLDGELLSESPAEARVLPGALNILTGENCA